MPFFNACRFPLTLLSKCSPSGQHLCSLVSALSYSKCTPQSCGCHPFSNSFLVNRSFLNMHHPPSLLSARRTTYTNQFLAKCVLLIHDPQQDQLQRSQPSLCSRCGIWINLECDTAPIKLPTHRRNRSPATKRLPDDFPRRGKAIDIVVLVCTVKC